MSIYDAIGGAAGVTAAVDDLYVRVLADEELAGYFTGVDMKRLKSHQRSFIAAAVGGPGIYRARSMRAAHERLDIRSEHFDRTVGHLVDTLVGLGVPEQVVAAIGEQLASLKADIAPGRLPVDPEQAASQDRSAQLLLLGAVTQQRPHALPGDAE